MALTVFTNAFLLDCTGTDPVEGAAVVVEGDRIKDVLPEGHAPGLARHAVRASGPARVPYLSV